MAQAFFLAATRLAQVTASEHSESVNILLDNSLKHRALQGIEMLTDRPGKQYIGAAFRGRPKSLSARDLKSESFATLIIERNKNSV
jgi:hypothetical protein